MRFVKTQIDHLIGVAYRNADVMASHHFHFYVIFVIEFLTGALQHTCVARRTRSAGGGAFFDDALLNSLDSAAGSGSAANNLPIRDITTVAVGDTAVLHCSFDALFTQLRTGNIDWVKELLLTVDATVDNQKSNESVSSPPSHSVLSRRVRDGGSGRDEDDDPPGPVVVATGRTVVVDDRRYRVYRPHNSALSVLIIRRVTREDAGIYRCNLSGSSTRHKFMILNVTDSKIEAETSPVKTKVKVDNDVTLWCNATGYPIPVVYWTREDGGRKLPDGSFQYWGAGLPLRFVTEADTGIYVCFLDNFVQPVVSYKFSVFVEDNPWRLNAYKMRFDSARWFEHTSSTPMPVKGKSFLLMCETRGSPRPPPAIAWYHDGKKVVNGKHFYVIHDSMDRRNSFIMSTLVIMRYTENLSGKYVCVASNGFRMKKESFYITDEEELQLSNRLNYTTKSVSAKADTSYIVLPRPSFIDNRLVKSTASTDIKQNSTSLKNGQPSQMLQKSALQNGQNSAKQNSLNPTERRFQDGNSTDRFSQDASGSLLHRLVTSSNLPKRTDDWRQRDSTLVVTTPSFFEKTTRIVRHNHGRHSATTTKFGHHERIGKVTNVAGQSQQEQHTGQQNAKHQRKEHQRKEHTPEWIRNLNLSNINSAMKSKGSTSMPHDSNTTKNVETNLKDNKAGKTGVKSDGLPASKKSANVATTILGSKAKTTTTATTTKISNGGNEFKSTPGTRDVDKFDGRSEEKKAFAEMQGDRQDGTNTGSVVRDRSVPLMSIHVKLQPTSMSEDRGENVYGETDQHRATDENNDDDDDDDDDDKVAEGSGRR